MFIGKSYEFLRKRLTQRLLVPLAGCMVFCQNPAVYGGVVIDDLEATTWTNTLDGLNYTNGEQNTSDGQENSGAVVIIRNTATNFTIGIPNGANINTGSTGLISTDLETFFNAAEPVSEYFNQADNIAILDLTTNNTTLNVPDLRGITGNVVLYGGDNTINVFSVGDIYGSIDTGDGNDTVTTGDIGWLHEYVNLRGGDNVVNVTEGTFIDGDVFTEEGNDTFNLTHDSYITGTINAGDGVDTLSLITESYVAGTINLEGGNDIVTIDSNGTDIFDAITGNINLGDGDDIVTVSGGSTIGGTINGGAGTDTVLLQDSATVSGSVNLESGNDVIQASSGTTISGNLNLGSDNDIANIDGATISGTIFTGDGDDVVLITNGANVSGNITGSNTDGSGTNFTLRDEDGFEIGTYFAQGDRIIIEDNSTVEGTISLNDGYNRIDASSSTISGDIVLAGQSGESQILNLSDSTFTGNLNLNGAGTATITLNGSTATLGQDFDISASTGNNTINLNSDSTLQTGVHDIILGAGNDNLTVNGGSITSFVGDAEYNPYEITLLISTGDGDDSITLNSGSSLASQVDVDFGSGNNTFALNGNAQYVGDLIISGTGTNNISFNGSGQKIDGTLTLSGTNNFVVYNQLTTTQNSLSDQWDHVRGLTVIGGAAVTEAISLAPNVDQIITLQSGAEVSSDIVFSTESDTLSVSTSTINGSVNFGAGSTATATIADSVISGIIVSSASGSNNFNISNSTIGGEVVMTNTSSKVITIANSTLSSDLVTSGSGNATLNATNATFSGDVNMRNNSGTDTVSLTNSTVAGELNFGFGDGTVTLNSSTITGNSDAGDGTDALIISGTGAINSSFTNYESLTKNGTGTWDINKDISVTGDAAINGGIINLNADLIADSLMVDNGAILYFNNKNIVSNSPDNVTIASNSTLLGGGNITGNVVVESSATIGGLSSTDSINITGDLTLNDQSKIAAIIGFDSTSSINVSGTLSNTNVDVDVEVEMASLKADGDQVTLATAADGIDDSKYNSVSDTYIYTYDFETNSDANNLVVTIGREEYTELDSDVINELSDVAVNLEEVRSNNLDSSELLALETQQRSGFEESFQEINPSVLTHLSNIALNSHNNFIGQISDRMDGLQFGLKSFTLVGPNGPEGQIEELGNIWNMWVDTNYRQGELDSDGNSHGYEFDGYNFSIGGDISVNSDWKIGTAFSYGQADVEYNNNTGESDVDSYSLAGYAKFTQDQFFWDSILSLSMGEADTERNVNGTNSDIDSDADSMIYSLSTQIGYQIEDDNTFFTPVAGFSYSQSSVDGVDESGSVFAVQTDDQDYDSLLSKIGFRTGFLSIMEDEDFYTLELKLTGIMNSWIQTETSMQNLFPVEQTSTLMVLKTKKTLLCSALDLGMNSMTLKL